MSLAFSILPVWVDPTVHGHCGHGELLLALVKEQCWSGTSAGCMAGWWCRQVSAAKKSCHCSEKEWPYLCTLIFFWIIVTHVAARQQLAVHKVTGSQQGWGWLAPLEMASSSPLLRARPQQEQGYSSFLGATQNHRIIPLYFEYFQAWKSTASLSSLLLICTLYLQTPRAPLLCRNSKRHLSSSFCRDYAAFHCLCNCTWFQRTLISCRTDPGHRTFLTRNRVQWQNDHSLAAYFA